MGSAGIILLTSVFFFIYDALVRRDLGAKKDLLDAKRRFVRFVSHEVRTPLNQVCMGLEVIHDELQAASETPLSPSSPESGSPPPHDKKTMLTLASKMSRRSLTRPGQAVECLSLLQDVRSSAQSAVDVLNDMLNYDRVQRRDLSMELSVMNAWDLVERTVNEFQLPAANKQISLQFKAVTTTMDARNDDEDDVEQARKRVESLPSDLRDLSFLGDEIRLKQVLRNLISNAIKFTPPHGSICVQAAPVRAERRIRKGSKHHERDLARFGNCRITVQDSGAGLTAEQLDKLFQEGVQFNAQRLQNGQGSGLGLFITKGIVEQHQGSLKVHSDGLGLGTTFELELPLYEQNALTNNWSVEGNDTNSCLETFPTSKRTEQTTSIATNTDNVASNLRILVVDDVYSNRKLLRRLLEKQGHTCTEAEDGQKAIELWKSSRKGSNDSDTQDDSELQPFASFDTILMDYEMPVLNGPSAAQEMRRLGCHLFIVGVTGNMLPDDVAYFKECGANAVVSKPLRLPELDALWRQAGVVGVHDAE